MKLCPKCNHRTDNEKVLLCPICGTQLSVDEDEVVLSKDGSLSEAELTEALAPFIYKALPEGGIEIIEIKNGSATASVIPYGVTSIGEDAFYLCTSLESVTISDSVTSIGEAAFEECTSLKSITIPNSVTGIGVNAFFNCTALTDITIPDSVTSIGEGAFLDCASLESITIPDSVTSIVDCVFCNCTSLASVIIPNSVTSIGEAAFYNAPNLKDVYFKGRKKDWEQIKIAEDNQPLLDANIHFEE